MSLSDTQAHTPADPQAFRPLHHLALFALLLVIAFLGHGVGAADAPPNLERALAAQYAMVAERPYDATVQNDLGNLLMLAERQEQAEEAYRRALEIDETHRGARFNLALSLQSRGRDSEAVKHLATLLELDPRHAWAQYQKGVSHERLAERRAAIRHYSRAFALDPSLSFAENNPHIIDNQLATEALLVSGRAAGEEVRRVPRQYDEAQRIAELMLTTEQAMEDAPADEPLAAETRSGVETEDVSNAPSGQPVRRADSSEGSRPVETAETPADPEADEAEADDPESDHAETPDERNNRVITADDLERGRSGGAVTPRAGQGGERSEARRPARRSTRPQATPQTPTTRGRTNDRPQSVTGGEAQGRPQGNQRYRPSRRSSASLELKLLPPSSTSTAAAAG